MKILNSIDDLPINSKLCIYGASERGSAFKEASETYRKDIKTVCFVDTFKTGEKDGLKIISPKNLEKLAGSFDIIVITSLSLSVIEKTLKNFGIDDNIIFALHPLLSVKTLKENKLRFFISYCLSYDNSEEDIQCLNILAKYLIDKETHLAFYGAGKLCRYFLHLIPELKSAIEFIIEDNHCLQENKIEDIPIISCFNIPNFIKTVFLCSTRFLSLSNMQRKLKKVKNNIEIVTLDVLKDLAPSIIPKRAWRPDATGIYPIEIPDIEFLPEQDLILLELPARYMPMLPNGLGYVNNILKNIEIRFQTVDLNIIFYHRYHSQRILDVLDKVISPTGYVMKDDPWETTNIDEWSKMEVIEYFREEINEVIKRLCKARPKIVGLSLHSDNLHIAKEVVKGLHTLYSDVIILVGGYLCVYPDVGSRIFPEYDYMVIGEAELVIMPLLKSLLKGEKPKDLPGIISKYDSPNRKWIKAPLLQNIDSIDFPQYEWTDFSFYRTYNGAQLAPVVATRGCRWSKCTFCAECFEWRKRSPQKVVDEFEWFVKQNNYNFQFNESDLNGDPNTLLEICDEIIRRKLKITMIGQLRIHKKSNREFFERLHSAGFISLRFGVDAWSENTLLLQKKGYTLEMIDKNLRSCYESGISVAVNLVIGVPGETDEDIKRTIANILKNKDYINQVDNIHTLILAAGSEYYKYPERHNIYFRTDKLELYTKHPQTIPPNLWYSLEPYIDHKIRLKRLKTICSELSAAGVRLGSYAEWKVQEIINDIQTLE